MFWRTELTKMEWEANCSLGGKEMWEGEDVVTMKGYFTL